MLVNPPPEQYLESYDTPDYGHIGMAYIAASLEKKGFQHNKDLFVVDAKLARLKVPQVLQMIRECNPDIIGITSYTFDILYAGRLAKIIKEINPNIEVVVGGVHTSAIPVETLEKIPEFDIAMVGECELTFPEVIKRMSTGEKDYTGIGGVAWRNGDEIKYDNATFKDKELDTPVITRFDNMDDLPFPAWHMLPPAYEYQIMSARGCPRACVFCMSPYGRKTIREMSAERVIAEMEWVIDTFHPGQFKFNDETFAFNPDRMHQVLDKMIEKDFGKKTHFIASMRADKMEPRILKKMKAANFQGVEVGVETGDVTIMKKIKKGETMEETEQAVQWVKESGMEVYCGFIIGHPGDNVESVLTTIDFAAKLNPTVAAFGLMVPYPGTEVAEYAQKGMHGYRLLSTDWNDYNKQYGNALELEDLPRRTMERLHAWAYIKVFLKNFRLRELAKFMWTYRKAGWYFLKKQFTKDPVVPDVEKKPVEMKDTGEKFRYLNYRT